jgi:cation:H+ antiporter
MIYYTGFIFCAVVIFYAGTKLSYYGDQIALKTRMSKGWIGLILMASVTSMPELMVGISSSAIVKSADLAVGDILGSCAFNLCILALLDVFVPDRKPLFGMASSTHMLNAGLGIILITMVGFALLLEVDVPLVPWIELSSILFIVVYLVSLNVIYRNEKKNILIIPDNHNINDKNVLSLKNIIARFSMFSLLIIAAALALPFFADHIAEQSGLGKTFVGTLFLAVSTSLPEIAVSISAVRMGSIDLSIGNLLGSNLFNVFILGIDDMFYTNGFILKDASNIHYISVLSTIIMFAIVIIGLSLKVKGKKYFMAWDAALIFCVYVMNLILLYHFST